MFFKPRIFISSTLDLASIRGEIESLFESVGAETMLYEKNLTPSINRSTYRQDVLEADFAIFIFEERYGGTTETGKSGTNEEWDIVAQARIPAHVYIKKTDEKEDSLNRFLSDEIQGKRVSYYYYSNTAELLEQIRRMIFTVARDITLFKIEQQKLPDDLVRKLAVSSDYSKALSFIRTIEELGKTHNSGWIDILDTTILTDIMQAFSHHNQTTFIDSRLNLLFGVVVESFEEFREFHARTHTTRAYRDVHLKTLNADLSIGVLDRHYTTDYEQLEALLTKFLDSYKEFRKFVLELKNDLDIYY